MSSPLALTARGCTHIKTFVLELAPRAVKTSRQSTAQAVLFYMYITSCFV